MNINNAPVMMPGKSRELDFMALTKADHAQMKSFFTSSSANHLSSGFTNLNTSAAIASAPKLAMR